MALNDDLAKASAYGKLDHEHVTAWLNLWNNAAHGDYDIYNRDQVRLVLQGVTEWLPRMTVQCACVFIEAECDHRRFLPVTDDIIRWHLSGHDDAGQPFVAGVYPMLQDESCFFLAIDFDKQDWQQDVSAFLETCRELKLPVALERSRSGRGCHVWFFFAEAIPAALARKLGSFLLTETTERRPDIGLDSYDRLFPNQDTLPQGGFGNLIAMPPQKQARERGNSVFVRTRARPSEPLDPHCRLSESRVLQSPGDATADLRQAAGRRLCRAASPSPWAATRMPHGSTESARRPEGLVACSGRTMCGSAARCRVPR